MFYNYWGLYSRCAFVHQISNFGGFEICSSNKLSQTNVFNFFFFRNLYTTQKSISNCNVNRYLCVSNSTGFGETGSYQNLRSHFSNNNFKYENVVFTMKEVLTQLFWLFHMYCWNKLSEKYRITNHSFNFWLTFYSNYTYYILTDTIF